VKLPFTVSQAAYSRTLELLVLVDRAELRLVSPETCATTKIALPSEAIAVAVSPNGMTAVVSQLGRLTAVDLQAAAILATVEVPAIAGVFSNSRDIALDDHLHAYLAYQPNEHYPQSNIMTVDLSSSVVSVADEELDDRGNVTMAADSATLFYGSPLFSSHGYVARLDVTGTTPRLLRARERMGNCGPLHVADDGVSLFSQCPPALRASTDPDMDLRPRGMPEGTVRIQHVATHAASGRLVLIRRPSGSNPDPTSEPDDVLRVHDLASLALIKELPLPMPPPYIAECSDAQVADPPHGKSVFIRADGARYYVLAESYFHFQFLMRLAP
jgi:hypothetical protein